MNISDYDRAMKELRRLDSKARRLVGNGVIVAVKHGYVSGMPYLTTSGGGAFTFADREQAQAFIDKFPRLLKEPRIVEQ